VVGALLGQQSGRTVEVSNSFELALTDADRLDRAYLVTKQTQCACTTAMARVQLLPMCG
jgi:hypothetical protein